MQNDKNICGYIGGIDIHSNNNKDKFAHLIGAIIKRVDNSSFGGITINTLKKCGLNWN